MYVTYKQKPIESCDFQYHLGDNWSEPITCRDGYAELYTFGQKVAEKLVRFRVDYMYEDQWHIDDEVEDVMGQLRPVVLPEREKGFTPDVPKDGVDSGTEENVPTAMSYCVKQLTNDSINTLFEKKLDGDEAQAIDKTTRACASLYESLQEKNSAKLEGGFTAEGWSMMQKVLKNGGHQQVLNSSHGDVVQCAGELQYRNVPIQMSYGSDRKSVVENMVFRLNGDGQVESVAYGVNRNLYEAIMGQSRWDDRVKLTILNFIENYQTAYALKRLDYLEQIFADNALIITGTVLKQALPSQEHNDYMNVPLVKRTQYTKEQYLSRLRNTFRSNECISIRFADISITESKVHKGVFGLRMRQDYYSTTYGDSGWLFLMVDLRKPSEPIIHVRVWQEEKDATFGWADIDVFD